MVMAADMPISLFTPPGMREAHIGNDERNQLAVGLFRSYTYSPAPTCAARWLGANER